jgi:hypothetical protein
MKEVYNVIISSKRTKLVLLLVFFACQPVMAADIVVIGRLETNEPMDYVKDECPENAICLRSWYKSIVQIQKAVRGISVSGRITAANMQHTSLNSRFKKAVRLFVLEPIEDPGQRAKLRAHYYLKEMSEPHQMFCLSRDPKELSLNAEETYVARSGSSKSYCFELPTG